MNLISGADGCRAGWVVVSQDLESDRIAWRLCRDARSLIRELPQPGLLAIDIPIGLPESGPRAADWLARRLLGPGRGSSVFPAPLRAMLAASSHRQACELGRAIDGRGLSIQAWGILPKIREVDDILSSQPGLQQRVREVHPEVCFRMLAAGAGPRFGKKTPQGRRERLALLEPVFGSAPAVALAESRILPAQPDDILDAFVALWTARRLAAGQALSLPPQPTVDRVGLRMEIVY